MDQVFKPGAVNVVQFICRNNLDIRHQEGRIEAGIRDASRDIAAGHADLVQNITIGRDGRMIGFTAQHIDDAACLIPSSFWSVKRGPADNSMIRRPAASCCSAF